jgi:uncharacterized membrane protein YfcA
MVGLGGGFVVVPMLIGLARFTQHQAHGTSLAAVVACSIGGAATYSSGGTVNIPAAACMAATGILTAGAGARYATALPAHQLALVLGLFMCTAAPLVPLKPMLMAANRDEDKDAPPPGDGGTAAADTGGTAAADDPNDILPRSVHDAVDLPPLSAGDAVKYGVIGGATGFCSGASARMSVRVRVMVVSDARHVCMCPA